MVVNSSCQLAPAAAKKSFATFASSAASLACAASRAGSAGSRVAAQGTPPGDVGKVCRRRVGGATAGSSEELIGAVVVAGRVAWARCASLLIAATEVREERRSASIVCGNRGRWVAEVAE